MFVNKMNVENYESKNLDDLIDKEDATERRLLEELAECRQRKRSLVESKAMLMGNDFRDFDRKSIPDLLEILFRKYGVMHIKDAAKLLESEFGRVAATQTVSGALIRYANQGKRFKQLGNNTFDIADRYQR